MSRSRSLVGTVLRAAVRGAAKVAAGSSPRLRHRFEVDEHWRRVEDGAAARLGPRATIDVTRVGRWRRVDPLVGTDGWRRPGRTLGLLGWMGALGVAWWLGASRGRGPLGVLQDRDGLFEGFGS